jgi:hypothetical protein
MARRRQGTASPLERALRDLRPGFAMLVVFSCGINLLIPRLALVHLADL